MANRFKDILAEELGFPTTQDKKRALRDWNELEQAIQEIDQNYEYQPHWLTAMSYISQLTEDIDDIFSAQTSMFSGLIDDSHDQYVVSG